MRASAERLEAEFLRRADVGVKLKKAERELLAFLELHPGPHNLGELGAKVKRASEAARALAKRELIKLEIFGVRPPTGYERPTPVLNPFQEVAFPEDRTALQKDEFKTFLLQGVTGSGKTEVYLRSIEAALALGKNALLLVPEIALTPAVAGQFFQRFGKQVAILHSAFGDSERADQWRRIQRGQARVIVGTRSGVFALCRIWASSLSMKSTMAAISNRKHRGIMAAMWPLFAPVTPTPWPSSVLPRPPSKRATTPIKASTKCCVSRTHCTTPYARGGNRRHACRVSRNQAPSHLFRSLMNEIAKRLAQANKPCCCSIAAASPVSWSAANVAIA